MILVYRLKPHEFIILSQGFTGYSTDRINALLIISLKWKNKSQNDISVTLQNAGLYHLF